MPCFVCFRLFKWSIPPPLHVHTSYSFLWFHYRSLPSVALSSVSLAICPAACWLLGRLTRSVRRLPLPARCLLRRGLCNSVGRVSPLQALHLRGATKMIATFTASRTRTLCACASTIKYEASTYCCCCTIKPSYVEISSEGGYITGKIII